MTALHPDSINTLKVTVGGETAVEEWEATPGSAELQEIPGLEGFRGIDLEITGVMEEGEYLAILEVRAIFLRHILESRPSLHMAHRSNPILMGYARHAVLTFASIGRWPFEAMHQTILKVLVVFQFGNNRLHVARGSANTRRVLR